jgi:hypothetical protein
MLIAFHLEIVTELIRQYNAVLEHEHYHTQQLRHRRHVTDVRHMQLFQQASCPRSLARLHHLIQNMSTRTRAKSSDTVSSQPCVVPTYGCQTSCPCYYWCNLLAYLRHTATLLQSVSKRWPSALLQADDAGTTQPCMASRIARVQLLFINACWKPTNTRCKFVSPFCFADAW